MKTKIQDKLIKLEREINHYKYLYEKQKIESDYLSLDLHIRINAKGFLVSMKRYNKIDNNFVEIKGYSTKYQSLFTQIDRFGFNYIKSQIYIALDKNCLKKLI